MSIRETLKKNEECPCNNVQYGGTDAAAKATGKDVRTVGEAGAAEREALSYRRERTSDASSMHIVARLCKPARRRLAMVGDARLKRASRHKLKKAYAKSGDAVQRFIFVSNWNRQAVSDSGAADGTGFRRRATNAHEHANQSIRQWPA